MASPLQFNGLPKCKPGDIARDTIERPKALRLKMPRPMAAESTVQSTGGRKSISRK